MVVTKQKIKKNWFLLIIIVILGFIGIVYLGISSASVNTEDSADTFKNYVLESEKRTIQIEVENRILDIEYELNIQKTKHKNYIKHKIEDITKILLNSNSKDIIGLFNEWILKDDNLNYFLMDKSGNIISSNISLINLKEQLNTSYVNEILKSKNNSDGMFFEYYLPKIQNKNPIKNISFFNYVPELDVIIGISFNEEEIIIKVKNSIIPRYNNYYKNNENYLFIITNDGKALVHGDQSILGKNTDFILDRNGNSVTKKMFDIVNTKGEGFISYPYKPTNDVISSDKISFVKDLKYWNAYIGLGFYTEDLESELNSFINKFESKHIGNVNKIFLLFILILTIVFYLVRRGIKLQLDFIRQEEMLFDKLMDLTPEGIIIISPKGVVLYQNYLAKKLLENKIQQYISSQGELKFPILKHNIFKFTNNKNRTYYIEYRSENIIFHGFLSSIFFIRDVTKEYIKSNNLRQMALNDELTKLPNRRKLFKDLENIYHNYNNDIENIIFAIIDLDNFKLINDNYGHDVGDQVLIAIAEIFNNRLRHEDNLYRYGGEEFILILKNIELKDGIKILNDINFLFKDFCSNQFNFPVTFSAGLMISTPENFNRNNFDNMFKIIDELLYKAKQLGRNRVEY